MNMQRLQRGVSLVMAMVVVVTLTMLVAGALSFTGAERMASGAQVRGEVLSGCAQAARNLFLSHVRSFESGSVKNIDFKAGFGGFNLASSHYASSDGGTSVKINHVN